MRARALTSLCQNEELRKAGTGAQGYAATMVPMVVSISYINYAIVAVLGGLLALNGHTDLGSLASYLVICSSGSTSNQPVYTAK